MTIADTQTNEQTTNVENTKPSVIHGLHARPAGNTQRNLF